MTRDKILDKAKEIITKDRQNSYGTLENNFKKISEYWSSYLNKEIKSKDVAIMMTLLKIARMQTGTETEDSYTDAIGYLACGYEVR